MDKKELFSKEEIRKVIDEVSEIYSDDASALKSIAMILFNMYYNRRPDGKA